MTQQTNGKTEEESRQALLERLIKILGMTTTDNDNVALVAMRRANECLDKLETNWERLLHGKVTIIADPFVSITTTPPATPPKAQAPRHQPPPARPTPQPTPQQAPPRQQPRWKPTPPPRFKDVAAIQACIDKIVGNPIKHQGTQYRIEGIIMDFQKNQSLAQADWSFLAGTAASLRGAAATVSML